VHPPSTIILGVCAGLAALDIVLALYLLRNMGSTLVVTPDDITTCAGSGLSGQAAA
jgi:hypothetical protein